MTKEEHFLYYSKRIQERLTIINQSINDGSDISENDTAILRSVFDWYDKDVFYWLNKVIKPPQIINQSDIFDEERK